MSSFSVDVQEASGRHAARPHAAVERSQAYPNGEQRLGWAGLQSRVARRVVCHDGASVRAPASSKDGEGHVEEHRGAIQARGLERTFKGGVEAVRGIDMNVAEGEIFGFLGPNGAGKTTTVRMLTTLLPPSAGSARIAGVDVMADPATVRTRIGVALQEIGLDPVQTGRELLELQCGLYGITGAAARARAGELLELVGLTEASERRTKTYSGGMKRRLDLASALVHSPRVLFLDEPTTGLDPASRLTIWEEVRRINGDGTTVFLTTQYLEEADRLCDRLAIIDEGRIVSEGTPQELKSELGHDVVSVTLDGADGERTAAVLADLPGLERVVSEPDALALYVDDGPASVAEVVRRLDRASIRAASIAVARPTLDDVFLRATGRRLEGDAQEGAGVGEGGDGRESHEGGAS
jgi:ABC-2 type transport system ATP-binding protein